MKTDPDLAEWLMRRALKGGADMAEVWQRVSRSISADAKGGEAEAVETASSFGFALRLIKNGRLGFSYANTGKSPERAVETALSMSSVTEEDRSLDLPEPEPLVNPPDIYDTKVNEINEQNAISIACSLESAALKKDARIKKIRKASASFSSSETLVLNSKGIFQSYSSTLCSGHIMAIAEESGDSQMGWGYEAGRYLDDVSFKRIGDEAAQRAVWMLGGRRIKSIKAPVFLGSDVVVEFLSIFAEMLSAEAVLKEKSLLKGKVGQVVLSEKINITDNGLLQRGPGARAIDDEGVPSKVTPLIENGMLFGYLHNTHTARKINEHSTGNAIKRGISSIPGVGISNLVLSSPKAQKKSTDLLKDMSTGLFVTDIMGMHTANPVSGHFSVGVSGLWVDGGELKYPVKEAVISDNLLELFSNIKEVGTDVRFYGNIGSPGIMFGETDISA